MKRETRANWWFIVIFLIVTLPGAVILFIKKMDPSASRFDQPEGLLTSLPYMAPFPAPPDIKWIVPPKTLAWLHEITSERTGFGPVSAVPPGPEWEPVISPDHELQLMSARSMGHDETYDVIFWDRFAAADLPALAAEYEVSAGPPSVSGAQMQRGEVLKAELITVPPDVRKELIALGYPGPPLRVLWIEAKIPRNLSPGRQRITVSTGKSLGSHGPVMMDSSVEFVAPVTGARY